MPRKHGPKIVMVGGGSYNWCPRLIRDLLLEPALEGSQVVLLDPNLQAASEVKAAAEAMAAGWKKRFTFTATGSEAAAFAGADFAVITISTGGLKMMAHDLKIPEQYGIFQTVGDTVGPGGWSRAMRNVPVFVHLASAIEKHAPRAAVLNYTNPLAVLTGTVTRTSRLRNVGLCHGVFSTYRLLQKLFGVEEKDLAVRFGGVNHFFWVFDFAVKGAGGYPALARRLRGRSLDEALREGETDLAGFHSHHALCNELYQRYGYLTYAGDRHTSEFMPGCLTPTESALKKFNLVRTSVKERQAKLRNARKYTLGIARGRLPEPVASRETAVDIMCALAHNRPFVDVVNVPNQGQIANLPAGAVVETLGLVDPLGFRPVSSGPMPDVLLPLTETHCRVQLMTLEAALTGDLEQALHALMLDPICSHLSPSQVAEMGIRLLKATKQYLPQFKKI